MMCDNCKRKFDDEEEVFYECSSCEYHICESCMKKKGKRCTKCSEGRLSRY
jgi:hypothetical protein